MGILITEQLLRSKSEHNEGVLYNLEEISLHQLEIDRITMINSCCRELKILYLQNNNIRRIENINRCKELRYINFAINKVRCIEGLHRCEHIEKLDFTVNRIDARGLLTFERLGANHKLDELYCTGNPCTDIEGYRKFVIHAVPSVNKLDGEDVTPAERVTAGQEFAAIKVLVEGLAAKEEELPEPVSESDTEDEEEEVKEPNKFEGFGKKAVVKGKTPGIEPDAKTGVVRQCNEGNYAFKIDETDEAILVEVGCSKFLDTSLIEADIHPGFIRVEIKKKVLQLLLPCDCRTDTASVQRSQTTGALLLRCPKVNPTMRRIAKPVGVAPEPYSGRVAAEKTVVVETLEGGEQRTNGVGDIRKIAKESPYGQEHEAAAGKIVLEGESKARAAADDIDDDAPPDDW